MSRKSPASIARLDDARVRQRRARAGRDDRRKGKPSLPSSRSAFSSTPATCELGHPDADLRQRALERARRDAVRRFDQRELAGILSLAQRLHEVGRRPPLPARARLEQTLKVAMQQMAGLEPDHLEVRQRRKLLPEPRPQALRLDRDAREIADLVADLRLIAEVGDEHDVAAADEQQRARPGKSGEVADVRQARDEQPVDMGRREAVGERRQAARDAGQARGASFRVRPRSASSYPYAPSPTTTPTRGGREHRVAALGLARVDVREVHLDERQLDRRQRVANGEARVRVRAGVDHDAVDLAAQCVDRVDELALAVVLRELQLRAELRRDSAQRALDVGERLAAVQRRLASAEQIQIRAVEDGDLHVFFSPLSQLLNCAMSSPAPCAADDVASAPGFGAASFMSSAKN